MTSRDLPNLTDERLDRLIRQLLVERSEDVAADALSAEAMAERIAGGLRRKQIARSWVLMAAAAILTALVIGSSLAIGGLLRFPSYVPPPLPSESSPSMVSPTPTTNGEPWLVLPPAPTPEGDEVHGWPDTSENAPGWYSWTGFGGDSYHLEGFMHNGYGAGNVEIWIQALMKGTDAPGGIPVTVAGHPAVYERLNAQEEQWTVEIENTMVAIRLKTLPGTPQADLDEAYTIIGSMRTEADPSPHGFRLIFTLSTGDWDSG